MVDRKTTYIPLLIDTERFMIKVEIENDPNDSDSVYVATGSDFINLAQSHAGFGMNPTQAIQALLKCYGMPRILNDAKNANL